MTADGEHLLEIIQTQNEIASGGFDLQAVMDLVARRAVELTNAGGALVEMADGSETVCEVGAGSARDHVGERFPIEGSLSGLAIRSGQVLSSDNTDGDDRASSEICGALGAGSMIVVPLVHGGTAVGALTIYSPAIYHFRSRDVEVLRLLAGLIAAHMAQAGEFGGGASSRIDELTGIGNRRAYDEAIAAELSRSRRREGIVALLLFDVVGLGELPGDSADRALREIAGILGGGRGSDAAFRLEEARFAMVLPETDEEGARAAGGRIAGRIAETVIGGGRVRVSWGAAAGESDPVALAAKAERRLAAANGAPAA